MNDELIIGIADFKAGKKGMNLTTIGLGSCIGIILYHRTDPFAVLGHFMLPDSTNARKAQVLKPAKYCDTCIDALVNEMKKLGCLERDLVAKAAGGASMFKRLGSSSPIMDISQRNIESLKINLKKYKIRLKAQDLGGERGRTITFNVDTKELTVKVVDPSLQGSDKYKTSTI